MLGGLALDKLVMMAVLLGGGAAILWLGLWVWPRAMRKTLARRVDQRTGQLEDVSRRYRLMVDNGYDLTAVMSPDGKLDYVNSAYTRILGYPREGLRGKDVADLMHPRDYELLRQALDEAMGGISGKTMSLRFKHAQGTEQNNWVYTEAILSGLPDKDWVVRQVVLHARDITARKLVADDLARSEQRFRDFAGSSADWLWEVNEQLQFTYVSPGVTAVLGHDPEELIGTTQLSALFEDPEDKTKELIESAVERRQGYRDLEFWSKSKQGDRVCLRLSAVPVFNEYHVFLGYRGAVSNITASKLDSEHMFRLATTDHLTGLLNRNRFKQELERAVALARRHNTQGIVMFVDLDRFKEINDTHGHEAGDKILVGVSKILRESVRSTDVVARLGGDEFAVIMHNIELSAAQEKVQQIVEGIAEFSVEYQGARLGVTMSAGMVHYPQDDKGADHLLMSADLAMYRAKDMGRNRLFTDLEDSGSGTKNSVREQLKGVDRLRQCLDTGDFQLYLQPLVSRESQKPPLFECLLRIFDEEGKMLSPALYIDAAEHFGLIQRLDLAVVRKAFEMQKELIKAKTDGHFTINLSCRSLGDKEVMVQVKELVKELKIDPTRVVFEVTETMALHDPAEMRDIADIEVFIKELQALGFRFALDDFGSGFTSFKYLKLLPVDMVKIDGEYIKDLTTSYEDRLFVENMVNLCRGLGILTVAEFVENEELNAAIMAMGIDYGQGWHYGKPMPGAESQAKAFAGKTMKDFLTKERAATLVKQIEEATQGKVNVTASQSGLRLNGKSVKAKVEKVVKKEIKPVAPKKMVAAKAKKPARAKTQALK